MWGRGQVAALVRADWLVLLTDMKGRHEGSA